MGLFDTIINAIDSSDRQGSSTQLATLIDSVQQLSSTYQTNPGAVESAMSVVGNFVRSSLQEKRQTGGEQQAQAIVNQFGGFQPSTQAINVLFSTPQIQQLIREVESRTGLNSGTIQGMLPILVPLVLNLLKTGNSTSANNSNSVLNSFLDADRDGDVDLADAMHLASRYLQG
ncbi:hypothetical protein [Oscillatoria salina]|uniref:hypothetical protein n=1 Tax=Oscillatoria salina TaxID=331517 RepID=UPI0013BD4059|nr:hypothetical protein [Oscillatoria salina]MBZ8183131.1 hypothetical protein [Oscillatoria salina IIICB1]NET88294.1 hypothetical protein [Kamptonema sp. SIO1D9]